MRDWDQFHSPKNLAMALVGEAGELVEHFQWLSEEQSGRLDPQTVTAVAHELADILIYLIRLADKLGVELVPLDYDHRALAEEMRQERLPDEFVETILTGWWTTCLEILPALERSRSRF